MKNGKKVLQKNHIFTYRLLTSLSTTHYYTCKELCDIHSVGKQHLNYWLKKLEEEHFIDKIYHGAYKITESGKEFLRQLEKLQKKGMIRLENMRYRYPIYSGLENILSNTKWDKVAELNNVKSYHTTYLGFSVRLYTCNEPFVEITCRHWYGTSIHEVMWLARKEVEIVRYYLGRKFNVRFGPSEESMKPDISIPSKIAESILKATGTSQIRTEKSVLNKSQGRGYDWETHNIESAQLVLELPWTMKRIEQKLYEFENKLSQITSNTGYPFYFSI